MSLFFTSNVAQSVERCERTPNLQLVVCKVRLKKCWIFFSILVKRYVFWVSGTRSYEYDFSMYNLSDPPVVEDWKTKPKSPHISIGKNTFLSLFENSVSFFLSFFLQAWVKKKQYVISSWGYDYVERRYKYIYIEREKVAFSILILSAFSIHFTSSFFSNTENYSYIHLLRTASKTAHATHFLHAFFGVHQKIILVGYSKPSLMVIIRTIVTKSGSCLNICNHEWMKIVGCSPFFTWSWNVHTYVQFKYVCATSFLWSGFGKSDLFFLFPSLSFLSFFLSYWMWHTCTLCSLVRIETDFYYKFFSWMSFLITKPIRHLGPFFTLEISPMRRLIIDS